MKKSLMIVAMAAAVLFSSCSQSFLDVEPSGSTIIQSQYEDAYTVFDASVLGIYSLMIQYGGSHDLFGQKCIDIHTDLGVGDLALRGRNYGWFETAAFMNEFGYSSFSSYMWTSYYYKIIKNCNVLLVQRSLEKYEGVDFSDHSALTDEELNASYAFGQALAMRGFCYFWLANYFGEQYGKGSTAAFDLSAVCAPIYTEETEIGVPQPPSTAEQVYQQAENDLLLAIEYLDGFSRLSKTYINQSVAKGWLAYLYLQRGYFQNEDFAEAARLATEVINSGEYSMMPYSDVLTTGFTSVSAKNWMWAQDVTTETATGLASYFGQMDVFTYSYAMAGDYKACDDALYALIPTSDRRKQWFQDVDTNSAINKTYTLAPLQKFYDTKRILGGDRVWTNDICFMRLEEMYLIAAEAYNENGDASSAVNYLQQLVDERDPEAVITTENFLDQLIYNWRIELWGEGRSLLTRKRMGLTIARGTNHFQGAGQGTAYTQFYYNVPTSETEYNYNYSTGEE
ncbi:MAG: RagB/SusD family nutrient uptake outer membrane protein [Bacteroidales bacterium]|nr:RagB/SusD family nutrient uptake outer membrane protein [Bacteroidales bacterium]